MIRPGDMSTAQDIYSKLELLERDQGAMRGLQGPAREVFVGQLVESLRRVRYLTAVANRPISDEVLNPCSEAFDPLKGAVLKHRGQDLDEAWWLIFLATHFGRDPIRKWALSAAFYGKLGQGEIWGWESASENTERVRDWIECNQASLKALGIRFGNHRKYQTLAGKGNRGTGAAIDTYVEWVGSTHARRVAEVTRGCSSSEENFAALYQSLAVVSEFGRTARFDLLSTLGKLRIADVQADQLYLAGATGPLHGAKLLITGSARTKMSIKELNARFIPIQSTLDVTFDVLEDALCNWQKSPNRFVTFRG